MTRLKSKQSLKILLRPREPFQRIAFFGPMAVGKSWCATELAWHDYQKFSFASKLKALAYELYGANSKSNSHRKLLQDLSDDLKKYDRDVWIKYMLNSISTLKSNRHVVVDDLRYIREAEYLRENGFVLILVTCDGDVLEKRRKDLYPDTDPERHLHPSEQEWLSIQPDFTVNSTTPDAAIEIERILDDVTYRPSWEK